MLVSGVALMAGALASSGAQAQCTGTGTEYFPFGSGSGVNALTSVISTVNTAFLSNGSAFVSAPSAAPDAQGGGVWVKTVGGSIDTQANSSFGGTITVPYFVPVPPGTGTPTPRGIDVDANSSCRTKVQQDFGGFQAGHDIALLNSGNSGMNWHFGALAGYVETDFGDKTPGGTLSGKFEVPFAGLYSTFSKGNFFADAQGRLDYFQGGLTDPANGIQNRRLDARGYSLTGNMGYRFDLGSNWNVEPSVGGVISRTWVDPLDIAGTILPPGAGGTSMPGTVQMQAVESELGRVSVKVGTSAALGNGIVAYPFASASVFHEFAGNVTASVAPGPGSVFAIDGNLTVGRIGTYALFSAGSAFQVADTGWLSFARVDYRTGDNIQGISVSGGLRYQINPDAGGLKEAGSSKDSFSDGYSWTGPYVGVSAGSTWGNMRWHGEPFELEADNAGVLAGGQIGYNEQVGRLVWGVEADYGASNARGVTNCSVISTIYGCEDNVKTLGSVAGRLGYTFGRALFYGKAGWAFGEVASGQHLNNSALASQGFTPSYSNTFWEGGWTAGGGMEIALTDAWSAKAEYMYYEFSNKMSGVGLKSNADGDSVKVGINYHLGRGGDTNASLK